MVAAVCFALVLVAAGCSTANPGGGTARPASATPGAPRPSAAVGQSQSPAITPPLVTPTPAPSYPLIDSCDPKSVPGAATVRTLATGKASSFTLHVPILMYHRIVPLADAGNSIRGLVVPPETFAVQLDALQEAGWQTITMATLANDLQARVTPPPKTFVITIDDGWYDGYAYALPILESHGFVATYYVIAGRIDRRNFLSSTQLKALVAAGDDIGDHTMDHVSLPRQTPAGLTYEIDAAAARIAQVTGRWPESLAYPSGGVDQQVVTAAAACGELRMAVVEERMVAVRPAATQKAGASPTPRATKVPAADETWTDRFEVPRIRVSPSTSPAALLAELSLYQ